MFKCGLDNVNKAWKSTRFTSTNTSACNKCEYEYEYLNFKWERIMSTGIVLYVRVLYYFSSNKQHYFTFSCWKSNQKYDLFRPRVKAQIGFSTNHTVSIWILFVNISSVAIVQYLVHRNVWRRHLNFSSQDTLIPHWLVIATDFNHSSVPKQNKELIIAWNVRKSCF